MGIAILVLEILVNMAKPGDGTEMLDTNIVKVAKNDVAKMKIAKEYNAMKSLTYLLEA